MTLNSIIAGIGFFISLVCYLLFKGYKSGKDAERHEQVEEDVKEALDIKRKQDEINCDTPYDRVVERLRKYTRD